MSVSDFALRKSATSPVRKWYYLNGYFRNHTTDPVYPLNLPPEFSQSWNTYSPEMEFQLNEAYDALLRDGGPNSHGMLLDLSMFTEQEYQVFKASEHTVVSPTAAAHLRGKKAFAGFPLQFWNDLADQTQLLPKAVATWVDMGVGKVVPGFFQMHKTSHPLLEELMRHLQDPTGRTPLPASLPRKRIVLLIEMPPGWHDVRKCGPVEAPTVSGVRAMEDGAEPVYEWWFGDRGPEKDMAGTKPNGFWKKYHPKVCKKIEQTFRGNKDFEHGRVAADVDGVRYMIHHITEESPFDYRGKEGRGAPFLEDAIVTIHNPCYDQVDRLTGNCFVQFAKGDPARRRPARRILNAEDMARNAVRTGEPCGVCFSEDGEMTGCAEGHVICQSCLRTGLRIMAGDIFTNTNLLCGCFTFKNRRAVMALAERADTSLQEVFARTPANKYEQMEVDMEKEELRRQFGLGDGGFPRQLYMLKIGGWFEKVLRNEIAPEYYVCSHPDCATIVENWMKRERFDAEYREQGRSEWTCPAGHTNTVLPSEAEIREYNKIILVHPEYYVTSCSYSNVALRRRRLCKGCVAEGILMVAEHSDSCKHWPGDGRSHRHQFCFACTGTWGSECGHGTSGCQDPGIQQVRRNGDKLEIGFVDGKEYLEWLRGKLPQPPPTKFPTEPREVLGRDRQRDLGMESVAELLRESQSGTK